MRTIKKIYIDLDTLFDTRVALINQINPDACTALLTNKEYWLREHTHWPALTNQLLTDELFDEAWLKRDTTVLKSAMMTNIIPVLLSIISEFQVAKRENRVPFDIALEINIHPYVLDSEEMDELTSILQNEILHDGLPVLFVSVAMDELTPEFIDRHYASMFVFDYHRWIKHHCDALVKKPCKGLTMIVPKLYEKDPSKLPVDKKKEELAIFKLLLLELIMFEFVDARYFSILNPNV